MSESGVKFEILGLKKWLVQQCRGLGMKQPTAVQSNCVPAVMAGLLLPSIHYSAIVLQKNHRQRDLDVFCATLELYFHYFKFQCPIEFDSFVKPTQR